MMRAAATGRVALLSVAVVLISLAAAACRAGGDERSMPARADAPILLFNGAGASPADVAALETILRSEHLAYSTADSRQLNGMTESRIGEYRLLIVPGGSFEVIGKSLAASTTVQIRTAIRNGLNYLGICAGAFFGGNSPYNGLNLTSGARFRFYAAEARGIRRQVVAIAFPGNQTLDQYWEDGPQLTGWGAVISRFPDGTPAAVEGAFGNGWVMLTGVHPEAPASWRRGLSFRTSPETTIAYAAKLIRAALNRESLPHY